MAGLDSEKEHRLDSEEEMLDITEDMLTVKRKGR